jgi:hypothetical protein
MPALARARRLNLPQGAYEPLRPIKGRPASSPARRFVARVSDASPTCAEAIDAQDFLQAALIFAESCATCEGDAVNIAVTDADTGETHCFNVSLD